MIISLEKLVPHRSYRRSTDAPLIHNLNVVYAAFPVTNINTVSRIKRNKVVALKSVKMLENCSKKKSLKIAQLALQLPV